MIRMAPRRNTPLAMREQLPHDSCEEPCSSTLMALLERYLRWASGEFVYDIIATALGIQLYEVKTAAEFTDEELNKK